MLHRYSQDKNGKLKKTAEIYTRKEHTITRAQIDSDAFSIIDRLKRHGHSAYIVGGAVRDLLIGKKPKDFDIVTDAQPNRIKKIFWNARIIGRRFRLVHIFFDNKIFEVATFRSITEGSVGNIFGTIDEDVLRRDFTMNALYYDPREETILDYIGGFSDIRKKKVKPLIPLDRIFIEDPVRMIRAAKYAATTGFSIGFLVKARIRKEAKLLLMVSASRMTEEIMKIILSGHTAKILFVMESLKILPMVLPEVAAFASKNRENRDILFTKLRALDDDNEKDPSMRIGKRLSYIIEPAVSAVSLPLKDPTESFRLACYAARDFLSPINPPRTELEYAVRLALKKRGIVVMPRERRRDFDRKPDHEAFRAPRQGEPSRKRRDRPDPQGLARSPS